MAGTVTVTMSNAYARDGENIVIVDWTSTAGGAASGALCTLFSAVEKAKGESRIQPVKFKGFIERIDTIPGASGDLTTNKPTAAYTVTLTDEYGIDVAGGILTNRSITVGEQKVPLDPIPVNSELTINVSGVGGANQGRLIIYFSGQKKGVQGPYASA